MSARERPILFSGAMVRAIIDGRKTQTRRVCKGARELSCARDWPVDTCPYGAPGDRLWVRETLQSFARTPPTIQYAATMTGMLAKPETGSHPGGAALWLWPKRKTLPSIFMPRWASRILLEVIDVRVQRLQDISEDDALAEGCLENWMAGDDDARTAYISLWNSLNAARGHGWETNPWVWAISFKRVGVEE